jgi:TRAP-type C4-dicarboxylate transport system permease small subunit
MKKSLLLVEEKIHRCSNICEWASALSLFVMALLTFLDVFARYVIKSPIKGTQEIVELLMVLVLYEGMAWGTYKKRHITINVLTNILSKRVQIVLAGISSWLCILISASISVQLFRQGLKNFSRLNIATGTLKIPLAPFYILAAIGCVFLTFEFFISGLKSFIEKEEEA